MGTTNVYNVDYHYEVAGRIVGATQYASVSAAAQDYNSIVTVLNNNGLARTGQTIVLENVQADPSGSQTILT